jgi:hypothetical protein
LSVKVALEPAPLPGRRRAGEGRPAKPKGPSAVLNLQRSAVNRAVTALMRVESEVSDPL